MYITSHRACILHSHGINPVVMIVVLMVVVVAVLVFVVVVDVVLEKDDDAQTRSFRLTAAKEILCSADHLCFLAASSLLRKAIRPRASPAQGQ